LVAAAAAVLVIAAGGYVAPMFLTAATGTVDVQSTPSGVEVRVDGERRGATPARLTLTAGAHTLELRGRGGPHVTPITVAAGVETTQHFDLVEKPQTGQLRVQSQPAGAKVQVDGVARGFAPVTLVQLAPGNHEVVLQSATASVTQTVTIRAGATANVVLPIAEPGQASAPGWMTLKSPVSLEVREKGKLLGTSDGDRLLLSAGRHELEIESAALDYRLTRSVQIVPGRTSALVVELPSGSVNLNASPWAEVFIDGQRAGDTPIGNLAVTIGPHEVLFKNPQLGEKRQTISVTLAAPVRLSVDMK
ncbi:MAG TPA: PEGA domain-containing protein, partial [Gemmatimonadales bacterium]|nr:PEGA domain-containing protein [Gemmatimonadales bacterium]